MLDLSVDLRKCGALRDLVPFVQFKKHEKQTVQIVPNRVTHHKYLKISIASGCV